MKRDLVSHPSRLWYIPLITGILFMSLGILVLFTPDELLLTLSIVFALSFVVTGILDMIHVIWNRHGSSNWHWIIAGGISHTVIGIWLMGLPDISMDILQRSVGFGIMFRSMMTISWSLDLRKQDIENWSWLLCTGTVGLVYSIILVCNPALTGFTTALRTGTPFIVIGVSQISLSSWLRQLRKNKRNTRIESATVISSL